MKSERKYLIYGIRQEIIFPAGQVKNINIKTDPIITDDISKFKTKFLKELQNVTQYKDCNINIFLSYREVENEFLS